jgi:hypothetical protein
MGAPSREVWWSAGSSCRGATSWSPESAPRFEPWMKDGIRVGRGRCHVTPVRLTAELVPEG